LALALPSWKAFRGAKNQWQRGEKLFNKGARQMNIDSLHSETEQMIASIEEMIDWEIYCSNADNGFGGDITTGKRLPTLAEWLNRK
jgi:hypothetical protein